MYLITDSKFGLLEAFDDCKWMTVINSKDKEGKTIPFIKLIKQYNIPRDHTRDIVLFNYGKIIKEEEAEVFFMYNIHPSPLPAYRGPDPIGAQLLDGVKASVVTLQDLSFDAIDNGTIAMCQPYSLMGDIRLNIKVAILNLLNNYFNSFPPETETSKYIKRLEKLNTCSHHTLRGRVAYLAWHNKNPYVVLTNKNGKDVEVRLKVIDVIGYFSIHKVDLPNVALVEDNYRLHLVIDNKVAVLVKAVKFKSKKWIKGIDALNGLNCQGLITIIKPGE